MPTSGGKKQSQRTKGNLKPSSSSHAAALLVNQGTAATSGFIGFGQGPKYVPASETLDDMDSTLDSDFRMVLRKLTKRDSTTKIKSLQELSEICGTKEEDSIKAVLPFWPRIYNKMTMDIDYRVREAAQNAMSTLVKKAGRNVAPYLKSMMGAWLLNQCDTYPTVASAAELAFTNSFSPHKQKDVWSFSKDSILEYLSDNILKQTPQTLSDPKATDPEDMENKYVRVVTCSLLAVRKLLQSLPPEQVSSLTEPLKSLLEDPKFWKHGKHKVSMVKGAMYGCISGLCQSNPELCKNYVNKMAPLVFHSLDEKDPVICGNLWEAVLSLVNYLPECWKHINVQKGFMPKLKSVLENGCSGNAVVIGPSLLPFISKVPPDLQQDSDKFFQDFFTSFKTGLSLASVQTNRSECNALVRAYMECASFMVLKETTPPTFLSDQVLPLVESSLLEDKSQLHKTPLYNMVSQLLGPVHKGETEFWNHLAGTVLDALDNTSSDTIEPTVQKTRTDICTKLQSLIRALYYPDIVLSQKTGKVTFQTDSDIDKSISEIKLTDTGQKANLGQYGTAFVQKVVKHAFKGAYFSDNSDSLQLLSRLLEINGGDDVLTNMVQCIKDDNKTGDRDTRVISSDSIKNGNNNSAQECDILPEAETVHPGEYFVFEVCLEWLEKLQTKEYSEQDLKNVINIISLHIQTLEVEKINHLLEKLNEILTDAEGFSLLLTKLLSLSESTPAVQEWLRGPVLGSHLVKVVKELWSSSQPADSKRLVTGWGIISMVLSSSGNKELLVSRVTVTGLLSAVQEKLTHLDWTSASVSTELDRVARAVEKYFSQKTFLQSSVAVDLLIELFSISVMKDQQITEENRDLLQTIWSTGFSLIYNDTENSIRAAEVWSRVADIVTSFVNKTLNSLSRLPSLLSTVKQLLSVMLTSSSSSDVMTLCCQLFVETPTQGPSQVWEYLCVKGDYPAVPKQGQPSLRSTGTLYTTLYNTCLLDLARSVEGTGDTECSTESGFWGRETLKYILKCFQGYSIVEMSLEAGEEIYKSIETEAASELMKTLCSLVESMDRETSAELWNLVLTGCDKEPDFCLSVGMVTTVLNSRGGEPFVVDLSQVADRCSNLTASCGYLIHSCLPSLTSSDCLTLAQLLTAQVLSCSQEDDVFNGSAGILSLLAESVAMVIGQYESESKELLLGTLDQILFVKESKEDIFLYSSNISQSSATNILINADIARFLCSVVRQISETLSDKHWDFIMCSIASWVQSLDESKSCLSSSTAVKTFTVSVSNLVVEVARCVENVTPNRGYPDNLVSEWKEFFSDSIFAALLPIYVDICVFLKNQIMSADKVLLMALCKAVSYTPKARILEHGLPPLFIVDDISSFPDELQTLVNHIGPLMLHKNRATQMSAWHILNRIIGDLPQYDKEASSEEIATDHEEPTARGPPSFLLRVIDGCSDALQDLLEDTEIDRHRTVTPDEAGYHNTLAYLLSWQLIVNFFTSAPAQIRQEYARFLEEHHLVEILMWCLYKLMPANPDKMFDISPDMAVSDSASSSEIQHISCNLYKLALKNMPAMVRNWWKNCDRKTAAYVDKFTTRNVSSILCVQEIQSVQSRGREPEGMTVKTRPATREVIATYCLGEVTIEIVITLPANHPLGPISVKSEKRVGVNAQQWEKWLLQLNIFLQHQNGNIIDGLELWKNNIDKKFEGVDDCMICFSVLHGTNFQLPRITCKTCKKKFHSACLYKWFHTSHNSTCPLCRNVF